MNDHNLKIADYVAAGMPVAASATAKTLAIITLAEWNSIAGICGAALGALYLLWKWRREATKKDTNPPFPVSK